MIFRWLYGDYAQQGREKRDGGGVSRCVCGGSFFPSATPSKGPVRGRIPGQGQAYEEDQIPRVGCDHVTNQTPQNRNQKCQGERVVGKPKRELKPHSGLVFCVVQSHSAVRGKARSCWPTEREMERLYPSRPTAVWKSSRFCRDVLIGVSCHIHVFLGSKRGLHAWQGREPLPNMFSTQQDKGQSTYLFTHTNSAGGWMDLRPNAPEIEEGEVKRDLQSGSVHQQNARRIGLSIRQVDLNSNNPTMHLVLPVDRVFITWPL